MSKRLYQVLRLMRPHARLTFEYEREFEHNQWLSQDGIRQDAWQKLKRLVRHAYENVPFYQRRFQDMDMTPDDIQTEADFRRIPLLTKEDIRRNEDLLIANGFARGRMRRSVTSGSTGVPFVTYYDHCFEAASTAAFARSRRWFGWEFGDKVAWFWGRREQIPQTPRERMVYQIKNERWMDGFHPSAERMHEFARLLLRWKPDLIAGYTNVISLFAQLLTSRNITGIRPKFVETTANQLWPHERALIERAFQCPVSDRYSSNESGSVVAAECPAGNRHIFSDFCHVEILAHGRPVNPGEVGEVVTTPLYAFGMPLLRFRLGDAAILEDRTCPCGRGLPLLRDLVGRISSIFTLPSGKLLYGGAFGGLVVKDTLAIRKFRVHQHARDQIEVLLERGEGFDETIVELVRSRCLELLSGEPIELRIEAVDEIPSSPGGKHLSTISDVPVQLT